MVQIEGDEAMVEELGCALCGSPVTEATDAHIKRTDAEPDSAQCVKRATSGKIRRHAHSRASAARVNSGSGASTKSRIMSRMRANADNGPPP